MAIFTTGLKTCKNSRRLGRKIWEKCFKIMEFSEKVIIPLIILVIASILVCEFILQKQTLYAKSYLEVRKNVGYRTHKKKSHFVN